MTQQTTSNILIVDDDESICRTLSVILQSRGYQTMTVTTAKEALEKTKTQFFNLALLDIKLPDMAGTKLLAKLQETTPETIKIIITGYPSLKNAVEALNFGADSYIMKPLDPPELLKTIRNKLEAKQREEKITKEKLAEWVQSQARRAKSSDFQKFLQQTANELADFGLTRTQAKIYVTLVALGVASPSEIAALSKIRREEVYRTIPELEKHGITTRRLNAPKKFSALQPEKAIRLLTKLKLKNMKEQIDKLKQNETKLISQLKTIELPIQGDDPPSTIIITQQENLKMKLFEMTQNAKEKIDTITSHIELETAYMTRPAKLTERLLKRVKIRAITEKHEPDAFTQQITQLSKAHNNPIELRQIEKIPFNLTIIDNKEAAWGEPSPEKENTTNLWTNDPTQITVLKTAFENLWQKASETQKPNPKHHNKQP